MIDCIVKRGKRPRRMMSTPASRQGEIGWSGGFWVSILVAHRRRVVPGHWSLDRGRPRGIARRYAVDGSFHPVETARSPGLRPRVACHSKAASAPSLGTVARGAPFLPPQLIFGHSFAGRQCSPLTRTQLRSTNRPGVAVTASPPARRRRAAFPRSAIRPVPPAARRPGRPWSCRASKIGGKVRMGRRPPAWLASARSNVLDALKRHTRLRLGSGNRRRFQVHPPCGSSVTAAASASFTCQESLATPRNRVRAPADRPSRSFDHVRHRG